MKSIEQLTLSEEENLYDEEKISELQSQKHMRNKIAIE